MKYRRTNNHIMLSLLSVFTISTIWITTTALSPHRAMVLLNRYGYLDIPNWRYLNSPFFERSLIVDGSYKNAIRKFQSQYKLQVTGTLSPEFKRLLTSKRCGNPDFNYVLNPFVTNRRTKQSTSSFKRVKRYFVDDPRMKWLKKDLTWKINSFPTNGLSTEAVTAIFTKAFNKWGKVTDLNYRQKTDSGSNVDIIIEFKSREHGDSIPFDGPNYVLAHAFYPIGSNTPEFSRAGDAHFDDDEIWVDEEQPGGRNLLSVAIHELGHSMGLGHSAMEKAIMYPFYVKTDEKELELSRDDIEGMQSIYGPAPSGKRLPPIPYVPSNGHKYTRPIVTTTVPTNQGKLDMCNTTIDAVIIIREVEIYVFSGKDQWRVDFSKTVTSWISYELRDGPENLLYYWPILPKIVDHIDAGIERKDQKIYFFRNSRFWLLEDNQKLSQHTPSEGLPLTTLGLPASLMRIDTIFRWGHNKALYIMAGQMYWKIDESAGHFGYVYARYPRLINTVWKDVPVPIDVAFTDLHDKTYFIKGKFFYEFNNLEMRVEGWPMPLTAAWIGCKKW